MKINAQCASNQSKNIYSQFGEDGVTDAMLRAIGVTSDGWCLEVGASDGIFFSNTRQYVERGWNAILIESDAKAYELLKENCKAYPNCRLFNEKAGVDKSLDWFLDQCGAPEVIDLLCIDIDGQDYHLLNGLVRHRARVVVIEYDQNVNPYYIPQIGGAGQAGEMSIISLLCGKYYHTIVKTQTNMVALSDIDNDWTPEDGGTAKQAPIRVNLKCGDKRLEGYHNYDKINGDEVVMLPYQDGSVDEIRVSHLLEHFPQGQVANIVKGWAAKLKPGGVLKISVPDFETIAKVYLSPNCSAEQKSACGPIIMGGQTSSDDFHRSIYDAVTLEWCLRQAGLIRIERWCDSYGDCASLPISVNICGTKPTEEQLTKKSVRGVLSTGRLIFSKNAECAIRAFASNRIDYQIGQGAFWEQIMSRMLEKAVDDGVDYIVTTDYDTYYRPEHLMKLINLAIEYPEADAIITMQVKREEDRLLIGKTPPEGKDCVDITMEELQKPLYPVETGHFGLTIFKADALKRMPKPWFQGVPGPDNRWEENRLDPDIYFWQKWCQCGNTAFMSTQIAVGHLQLICTFPGSVADKWKPVHMYINDLESKGIPKHCMI